MLGSAFHHAVYPRRELHAGCLDMMQQIRAQHLGQGYSDWAYNKAVCHHNLVMDMRGTARVSGANGTQWANLNYWAVVALCDGRVDPIDDNTKAAFLRAHQSMKSDGDIQPHSEFYATGCPWDPIRDWIEAGIPVGPTWEDDEMLSPEAEKQVRAVVYNALLDLWGVEPRANDPFNVKRIEAMRAQREQELRLTRAIARAEGIDPSKP